MDADRQDAVIHSSWNPVFEKFKIINTGDVSFRVFSKDIKDIKIVLLGQDPYPVKSDGLSFLVPKDVKIPGSLKNIFKELNGTFPERGYQFIHGDLERWFNNGIFLLNCSLTIGEMKKWTPFINYVIKYISENTDAVFILLGNHAKSKSKLIDKTSIVKKFVTAIHPSPSTHGFIGSGVFKKVENVLGEQFNWQN